jgi:hypothetical protein
METSMGGFARAAAVAGAKVRMMAMMGIAAHTATAGSALAQQQEPRKIEAPTMGVGGPKEDPADAIRSTELGGLNNQVQHLSGRVLGWDRVTDT